MKGILYRLMNKEDIAQVVELEKQTFSRPWTKENFLESFQVPDAFFIVAQEVKSKQIVGYCGIYQSYELGNITNIAVQSEWRKMGIASHLLQKLFELGNELGMQTFVLEVRVSNIPAIQLYTKHGFQKAGIRKNFYAEPIEDAYIFEKHHIAFQNRFTD